MRHATIFSLALMLAFAVVAVPMGSAGAAQQASPVTAATGGTLYAYNSGEDGVFVNTYILGYPGVVRGHEAASATIPALTERTIDLNGNPTRIVEAGDADAPETIVLINGGPGSSSDYLHGLFALAGSDLRVVTYDQRGTGGTDWPEPEQFAPDALIADIEALRSHLAAEQVHLIGHSWGGFLAALYTATHPDRVASLTLIGPMPLAATTDPWDAGIAHMEERIGQLQDQSLIPHPIPSDDGDNCTASSAATYPVFLADPAAANQFIQQLPEGTCSIAAGEQLAGNAWGFIPTAQHQTLLLAARAWQGPLYVVFGAEDVFASAWSEPAVAAFSHAQVQTETVPAAGHSPWLEDTSLLDRIRDFVLAN